MGLLFPLPLRAALSGVAYHLLKGYLEDAGVSVSVYYFEDGELKAQGRGAPSLRELDAVLVSVSYEFDLPLVVEALAQGGVNPWREARGPGDPVIVAGGPVVTANPIPALGFADAILPGEAEPVLDSIINALERRSRRARLAALADAGLLVPGSSPTPVPKVYVKDLDSAWYPVRVEIPRGVEPVWGRSYPLETSRGCGRGCRFCMEGFIFRPPRHRSASRLRELVEAGVENSGVGRVSFYSLSFFDNPAAEAILSHVVESMGLEASVPSLRVDTLTPRRIELIALGGQRTLTIAPETGSCRIARAFNKAISPEKVIEASAYAVEAGIGTVKLYLITPAPGEGDGDLEETIDLVEAVAGEVRRRGGRVRVSVNPFIPKPMTPLQWLGAPEIGAVRRRHAALRRALAKLGVEADFYDPRYARVQAAVGRGSWGVERLVVEWGLRGGGLGALRAAARELGVNLDALAGPLPVEEDPPWHSLIKAPGAAPELLRREFELFRSEAGRLCSWSPRGTP